MMAVTVVCDEKSMVDKAREWGASPVIRSNVKRQTRVLLTGESGPHAAYVISGGIVEYYSRLATMSYCHAWTSASKVPRRPRFWYLGA